MQEATQTIQPRPSLDDFAAMLDETLGGTARRGADKAHRADLRMAADCFNHVLAAVHHIEDALRQALSVLRSAAPTAVTEARLVLFGADTYATAQRVHDN